MPGKNDIWSPERLWDEEGMALKMAVGEMKCDRGELSVWRADREFGLLESELGLADVRECWHFQKTIEKCWVFKGPLGDVEFSGTMKYKSEIWCQGSRGACSRVEWILAKTGC